MATTKTPLVVLTTAPPPGTAAYASAVASRRRTEKLIEVYRDRIGIDMLRRSVTTAEVGGGPLGPAEVTLTEMDETSHPEVSRTLLRALLTEHVAAVPEVEVAQFETISMSWVPVTYDGRKAANLPSEKPDAPVASFDELVEAYRTQQTRLDRWNDTEADAFAPIHRAIVRSGKYLPDTSAIYVWASKPARDHVLESHTPHGVRATARRILDVELIEQTYPFLIPEATVSTVTSAHTRLTISQRVMS